MKQELDDAAQIRVKTHEWLNSLQIAGVSERSAVIGAMQGLIERALLSGGVELTVAWLNNQAEQLKLTGDELLKAMKA